MGRLTVGVPPRKKGIEHDTELIARIVERCRSGVTPARAAKAEGVGQQLWSHWMSDPRGRFVEIRRMVEEARAHALAGAEQRVYLSKPLAWLEGTPRDPGDDPVAWTKPAIANIGIENRLGVQVAATSSMDLSKLSEEELTQLVELQQKALAEPKREP